MSLRRHIAALSTIPLVAVGVLALSPSTPAGAKTKITTVKAIETDFHIALSKKTFAPGTYLFEAENKSQTTHALEITGPGLKHAETKDIPPGKSAKLKVTFKKGKYDIFCPIPGHKMLGMNVNLVVATGKGASTTSATSKPSSGGYGY
jgi:uncharacterized cupredoxin-like copper-binding protein